MEEGLLVRRIRDGTVIDHIPAGRAFAVVRLLGLEGSGRRMAIVVNVDSRRMGLKDIVKVEGIYLSKEDTDRIALIAPTATINIIQDYRVREKRRVEPPEELRGILKCPNPTCITRKPGEPLESRMRRVSVKPPRYRCVYCGTTLDLSDPDLALASLSG